MLRNLPKIIVPITKWEFTDSELTGEVNIAGKIITGTHTLFVDEIFPGAELYVNNRIIGVVSKIQSNTSCQLEEPADAYTGTAIVRNFQETQDLSPVVMSDILFRIKINRDAVNKSAFLIPYTIVDNETPELVSYNFYGTPLYHWMLLLINDIIDPREEWPLSEKQLNEKLVLNYASTITGTIMVSQGSDVVTGNNTEFLSELNVGDLLYRNNNNFIGRIESISSNTQLRLTHETPREYMGIMKKLNINEVYEYREKTYGYVVDYDANLEAQEEIYPVTIYEYEVEKNEAKRNIRVLDPNFLTDFISEFNRAYTEVR